MNKNKIQNIKEELTIVVCGPVDAGKSSLIGVLTSGELDDGRGCARGKILKHQHEQNTGRTSNITFNPLVYFKNKNNTELFSFKNKNNKIISINNNQNKETSTKVISFVDLAGHEKYLKTTVYGVSGVFPDYGIIVIGANMGITKLTREHIGILYYLKIPFLICITKVDMAPKHVYQKLCNRLKQILSKSSFGKILYFISDSENNNLEVDHYINNMIDNSNIIPIISISNKSGININNLHSILSKIPMKNKWNNTIDGTIVYLDSKFNVPGIGLVVSGTIKGNSLKLKDKKFIGPVNGVFYPIIIKSIHNSIRQHIKETSIESQYCFALKFLNPKMVLNKNQIKKGMVLIDSIEKWNKSITKKFIAKITVLKHSTTIKSGYTPVIHCGPIRQAAKITLDDENFIRSGDSTIVEFTFINHSEFLEENMIFFFRDGNTKGVGEILSLNK